MLLYILVYYLYNNVEHKIVKQYRSIYWWYLGLNLKKYFLNLFGYGEKIEIIFFKNLFLFFILKPFFDLFKIFIFLLKEIYFMFLRIVFNILFDIGSVFKFLGKFKFIFLVLERRYFRFIKRLFFRFRFIFFNIENILDFSLQNLVYRIIDKFLLFIVKVLDFFFFNVKFVVSIRKIYIYLRHIYYYSKTGIAYIFKYIYMFILDLFWLLYLWKKYGYVLRFYRFYFYFLRKNKNIMMYLEKFIYDKAEIMELSIYLINTKYDLTKKLLKKILYIKYLKFFMYKLLKWCVHFFYFFFFYFTIVYSIFNLVYERMYDKMGIGFGENYRKDVFNYDKKIKEWIEYIIKV